MAYKTPGVYIKEISAFPRSVAEVETAIPAFIAYTEKAVERGNSLTNKAKRIRSLIEYEQFFGKYAPPKTLRVTLGANNTPTRVAVEHNYQLYYSLQLFFDNGGGDCYIVSVGSYTPDGAKTKAEHEAGLDAVSLCDEATLLVLPDAALLGGTDLTDLQQKALRQCARLQDRFCVFDLDGSVDHASAVTHFRENIGVSNLKYGAAYTPHLQTSIPVQYVYQNITLQQKGGGLIDLATVTAASSINSETVTAIDTAIADGASQKSINALAADLRKTNPIYAATVDAIEKAGMILPPGAGVVGVYATVDRERGVWKAPANVTLASVQAPVEIIDSAAQQQLTVDVNAGKSINAIRAFAGKGVLIWGARTLAGNDDEWRYVSVRRFFNTVEESLKKSTSWAIFEPNTAPLWVNIRGMIERYLSEKWRQGALAGDKPEAAFFVRVGLGETMTR
ncbi:MAG: phage tail sheath family protein, partial [Gammaproteobacteria bacterium]